MARHLDWWKVWAAASAAWVAYVWFAWAAQPTYEIADWLGYVMSTAAFVVPPVALALMSVIVRWCHRRMTVSTGQTI
jgi:hypothetical protein